MSIEAEEEFSRILISAGIDPEIYEELPRDVSHFIENCLILGIKNESTCMFNVDDIVIKRSTRTKAIIDDPYGVTRRWKVVACPFGLVVGRMLLGGSKLGAIEVLNHPGKNWYSIELDPTYVGSILLQDDGFDPFDDIVVSVKKRRQVARHNRSISTKILNWEHAHSFIVGLSPGDRLWVANTPLELTTYPIHDGSIVVYISDTIKSALVGLKHHSGKSVEATSGSLLLKYVSTVEPRPRRELMYT